MNQNSTHWGDVSEWYGALVGKKGHHYHKTVIWPRLIPLLDLHEGESLLDLGCGQGVLCEAMPKGVKYHGVDLSKELIEQAKKRKGTFTVADICKPLKVGEFDHATAILCLQNVPRADLAIQNAAKHVRKGGTFTMVLNHPCFRIPRQTHWEVDQAQKLQYRRVNRYLSPLKVPIQMQPSQGKSSATTWSFHHSISDFSRWLHEAGFAIQLLDEWVSEKKSTGKNAKMENRARSEFPLFLVIKVQKL
ncbi:MAG: methyltransferase domain-containing protein [Chlamydiales bacterium]|nr:methyltransferase domain-containing protein [Chlamydiales bacterium]